MFSDEKWRDLEPFVNLEKWFQLLIGQLVRLTPTMKASHLIGCAQGYLAEKHPPPLGSL